MQLFYIVLTIVIYRELYIHFSNILSKLIVNYVVVSMCIASVCNTYHSHLEMKAERELCNTYCP